MQAGPLTKLKNSTEYTLRYDFLDVTHSGRNFCINLYNGSLLRFNFSAIEEILSPFARQLATKFFDIQVLFFRSNSTYFFNFFCKQFSTYFKLFYYLWCCFSTFKHFENFLPVNITLRTSKFPLQT